MVMSRNRCEPDHARAPARKIEMSQTQAEVGAAVPGPRRTSRASPAMDDVAVRSGLVNGARAASQSRPRRIAVGSRQGRSPSPVLSQAQRRGRRSPGRDQLTARPVPVQKSASLPAQSTQAPEPQPSILKRSSSFLASLEPRGLCALLLSRRRRNRADSPPPPARKCVSFSADTRFAAGGAAGRTHEARQYRRGVLQDSRRTGPEPTNLPLSWEESLGGPRALLGAAQDADDELIKRIVSLAGKAGLGSIDLNAIDSTGRTAISYMAGNGSALMLEACLSFAGVDANLPDNEGNTPLHFAAQAGQMECLNILLQRCPNIEVDARNSLGFTPLMKAALQGRTKCAKILLFAGANPTLRDHGRGLRAEQWARFCGRYVCAEVIERFARHRLLEKTTSCRWGSEPELAAQVFQGKLMPVPSAALQQHQHQQQQPASPSGLKSKIRRVFRTSSSSEKSFSLVSQLTSAALCASSPVLPKPSDISPVVKGLLRPLSVPQLRITLVAPTEPCAERSCEKIEPAVVKPPRTKKKSK